MTTLEKVQAQITRLQAKADALVKSQSSTVIAKIRDLMENHGSTVADIEAHIGGKRRGRKPTAQAAGKTTSPAKYRDPKTGATWTGHGRAPAWIAGAKDRTKFLMDDSTAGQSTLAGKETARTDNYVRGPQAPKYRDPRSGATWSGRGPAPAWLAGAKDRSKFLIAAAGKDASTPKSAPARAVTVGKTTTTKVAGKKVAAKRVKAGTEPATAKKVAVKKPAAKKSVTRKAPAVKQVSQNPPAVVPISDIASAPVSA
ncbi:H-NS family nucleoid-associated regulatory protein [Paraburkholderia sp. BL10I2N1]|uniref:H-NS family nucleoid-associated regulatory protein n=1 Tax=Paraburkholderia sp. BL10I2N1 TaxID=1938796 RepID=UPI0010613B86|nr:H-NS family nucleoid-associated regulatory protein [Paraburkholderia sp. BL10I2N1]